MEQLNFLQDIGLPEQVSNDIFDSAERASVSNPQHMYGKKVLTPRLSAWYGDPDTYSSTDGSGSPMLPCTAELLEIKGKEETLSGIILIAYC